MLREQGRRPAAARVRGAQVYLIEVNTSPALYRCCALLAALLPPVVEEVVQRCVDPCFPPPPGAALPARPRPPAAGNKKLYK